jgi:hypothetical protein
MAEEKPKRVYFAWSSSPWRWLPNWDRVWRDHYTGIRYRVIKWGWWFWTVKRGKKAQARPGPPLKSWSKMEISDDG